MQLEALINPIAFHSPLSLLLRRIEATRKMGRVSKSRIPLLLLLLAFCFFCFNSVAADNPNFACDLVSNPGLSAFGFCNTSWTVEARARDLVQRLTLAEKIGFLGHVTAAVVRLGIPSYNWWSEALHGVSYVGGGSRFSSLIPGATSFPQVILTAASFNVSLFRAIGKVRFRLFYVVLLRTCIPVSHFVGRCRLLGLETSVVLTLDTQTNIDKGKRSNTT